MGHQIRFFLCDEMRAAIESEAQVCGAKLVTTHSSERSAIQFSASAGTDRKQGRLWTDTQDLKKYEDFCRAVKKSAAYDRESGLWVKRASRAAFDAYREERQKALADLTARNRRYAVEVLGGRPAS